MKSFIPKPSISDIRYSFGGYGTTSKCDISDFTVGPVPNLKFTFLTQHPVCVAYDCTWYPMGVLGPSVVENVTFRRPRTWNLGVTYI